MQNFERNRLLLLRMTLGMTVVGLFARFPGAYSLLQPSTITFNMSVAGAFWQPLYHEDFNLAISTVWPLFFLGWLAAKVRGPII
jgi:hypothetical protein